MSLNPFFSGLKLFFIQMNHENVGMLTESNFLIFCHRICRNVDQVNQISGISVNIILDRSYILANRMLKLSCKICFEYFI